MEDRKTLLINWSIEQHEETKRVKDEFVADTGEKISWDSFSFLAIKDFGNERQLSKEQPSITQEEIDKLIGDGNY